MPWASLLGVFKGRDIWLLVATGICLMIVEFSLLAHFVLYMQEMLLFAVVTAGFFLVALEAGGAFGKPISGLVSDRLFRGGRKKPYILMCGLVGAVCVGFVFIQPGSPSWVILFLSFVLGLTGIGWGGLHLTLVGEFAGRELAGTVTAITAVFLLTGNVVGPPIFGYIVDTTGSYQRAWQLLAVLSVAAGVLLLFVREDRRKI